MDRDEGEVSGRFATAWFGRLHQLMLRRVQLTGSLEIPELVWIVNRIDVNGDPVSQGADRN